MEGENINPLTQLFKHNLYANRTLIELCGNLNEEQLAHTTNGGFGSIRDLLIHFVQSEGGYLNRLTGTQFWDEALDWDEVSIAELAERSKQSGEKLIEIAHEVDPSVQYSISFPVDGPHQGKPFHFYNWTLLTQAINHATEHRTQIKVLLTQLDIEHPDLSAWSYMENLHGFDV